MVTMMEFARQGVGFELPDDVVSCHDLPLKEPGPLLACLWRCGTFCPNFQMRRSLVALSHRDRKRCRGINHQTPNPVESMQEVKQDRHNEDCEKQPCSAHRRPGNQQKNTPQDLAEPHH